MGWVRVKKAAEILRMSPETVRQWSNAGKIECQRSAAGQRVFDEDYLRSLVDPESEGSSPQRVFYVRSSSGQDTPMEAQSKALEAAYGSPVKVFSDKASGLNERRKGLASMLHWADNHPGTNVCVTAKDRLTRFGFTYLEMLIQDRGGKVVVLDDEATKEPHEALMGDFMALLASFSGRFYRIRGWNQQRRLLADARDIINEKSGQGA